MALDAGFAVALTIREGLLNDALLIAYSGGGFPRSLAADLPGGPPAAKLAVFLAPPRITCKANNTMTIAVQMRGPLSVTLNAVEETANVAAQLTLQIRPTFLVRGSDLEVQFGDVNTDVTATDWTFTVMSGSFSPAADSYLRSVSFRDRLQQAIRTAILFRVVALPKINISFLGPVLTELSGMTAKARVVGNALLLGLDVASEEITTAGNVNQLTDFARNNGIAAVTSAVAVPLLLQQIESAVRAKAAQSGASLDFLEITAQTGRFHVRGRVSKSTGSATFSFNLIPTMFATKPGRHFQYLSKPVHVNTRVWPALGFTTADISVNVDLAVWAIIVAGIATLVHFGVPFIIAQMMSSTAAQFGFAIANADTGAPAPRVQHLKPTVPGGASVRIAIEEFEITTAGTFIGITVQPQAPPGMLIGVTSIPSNYRASMLSYSVRLPLGAQFDDPALRIRWTVINASGTVLVNSDGVAAGRGTFTFAPESVGPGLSDLGVSVRVYRAIGAQITDIVNDSIALHIRGPLPPAAYVRWYYDVKNPQVTFDTPHNTWVYMGDAVARRHSNWHRADHPCANASKRSRYRYRTETRDTLPLTVVTNIALHRSELCDYCFYGSPAGLRPSL